MKKIISITFIMLLSTMSMISGCVQTIQKSSNLSSIPVSSLTSTDEMTSSSELTVSASSLPENSVSDIDEIPTDSIKKYADLGIYTYYLDTKTLKVKGNISGFMLYRRTKTSGTDISLNVLAYDIKTYGDHVFFLVNNDDNMYFPESNLNSVYRIEFNEKLTLVCTGYNYNNIDDAIFQNGNHLYYTKYNESAIFQSDLNGENVERISTSFSEDQIIADYSKLREPPVLFTNISIDKVDKDYIFIKIAKVNKDGYEYLMTYIKKSLNDRKEEKIFTKVNILTKITGGWIYYLGDEISENSNSGSEMVEYPMYELHRMKLDGSADEDLHVPCFSFDFAGEYLYVDTNLVWGDFAYWDTSRYKIDGTERVQLKYKNMERYSEGERLYFTVFDDEFIHVADSACNELTKINIKLPDESEVRKKLLEITGMEGFEFTFIEVVDQNKDWLFFDFRVTSTSPYPYFFLGYYKVNLNNLKIEKVSAGDFYESYPE